DVCSSDLFRVGFKRHGQTVPAQLYLFHLRTDGAVKGDVRGYSYHCASPLMFDDKRRELPQDQVCMRQMGRDLFVGGFDRKRAKAHSGMGADRIISVGDVLGVSLRLGNKERI